MKIKPFELERYFARYEFSTPYLLSCSDCEPLPMNELLVMADQETLEMWQHLKLGYTESLGHPALRQEITTLYAGIKPENVLVITPEEGIFIAMNVLLEQGDHVISTYPGYQSLYEIAEALGCELTKWTPVEREGWKFDLDELRSLLKPNTKLLVVNFPHNPTGSLVSAQEFNEILQIAQDQGITVFSDEMYRFLEYDQTDRLISASDLYEKAVSLSGLSKSFSLPGLRIGWLTTQDKELFTKFVAFKDYTTICGSAPSEILALIGLRSKDRILSRNLAIIKNNLLRLDQFFEKYAGQFSWIKPKAGSIGFARLLDGQNVAGFCADLVEKKGVMLLPSTVYGYDNSHFRVGFGRKNIPEVLDKLEEYLR